MLELILKRLMIALNNLKTSSMINGIEPINLEINKTAIKLVKITLLLRRIDGVVRVYVIEI